MKKRKKHISIILAILLLVALGVPAFGEQTSLALDVEGAILIEATTGQVVYEQDPHVRWAPASVTKVMTMLLALEAVKEGKVSLEDQVVASEYACSYGGSQLYLEPGEKFTLHEMLLGIAVGSGNDASVAVAEHISGSHEAFIADMNSKVKELGLENTNFSNSHGLDAENHYTSAFDMAQISRYLYTNYPEILEYTSTKHYTFREEPLLELHNTNKLLWWYDGADGFKTGFTSTAKRSLSSTVMRDGLRFIGVVLGAEQKHGHFRESMKMYNHGFSQFTFNKIHELGEEIAVVPVSKGEVEDISVVAEETVGFVIRKGEKEDVRVELSLPKILEAPLEKGQVVGEIIIYQQDQEVARENLIVPFEVKKATFWKQLFRLSDGLY
ncbi:MAG: D-alanyl-D-alanine carboxypeptidase family protein [Bacillota bacterium]|nr:D-alanyl-D-alanine carboxypeptidase family protein [Bacillota bacterium]